ncbi:MAG: DUF1573 domain-containing protein [Bacteroidetes bacterium]|nr:DUF1573 domain-containing protein [Bacteroidota bacterium]
MGKLILFMACFFLSPAQELKSVVQFKQEVYDFGTIDMPWIVYHTFTYKNISKDTIFVSKTEAHCGFSRL